MKRRHSLLWAANLALAASTHPAALAQTKIPVLASFSILGDLASQVGGERVSVSSLVGPDEDAHGFEPRPQHARTLLSARLLVVNGLGFDHWADKLQRAAGYRGMTLVASRGVQQAGHDPHAWQDPRQVLLYVGNIAAALTQLDPQGAVGYEARAARYADALRELDRWIREQVQSVSPDRRKVITSHDAFGYFSARYGVRFLAPQGISTEGAPSARQMAQLIRQMRRENIRALFVENMSEPRLLQQLAREAGATVGASLYSDALSKADGPGASYLALMRHNVSQLVAGMQTN